MLRLPVPPLPALTLALLLASGPAAAAHEALRVDGARLNGTLETLKRYGGNEAGGSDRIAFSGHNREALAWLAALMEDAGMTTHVDLAGNLIGQRAGRDADAAPLLTGSHVDTVPNGGHYDGIVGVLGAIEVARTLHDAGVVLEHPLEVAVWSNEEGGKTGSRSVAGSVSRAEMDLPSFGSPTLGEGIAFLGGDPERIEANAREPGAIAAYLELHVEQGAELDREGIAIGVVDGIVGIRRWLVRVEGFANHAGTTPMDQRQDALLAAARFVQAVREVITAEPGTQVGTVGRIRAEPGVPNVVPGRVEASLEIRDLRMERIGALFEGIRAEAERIGRESGTTFSFTQFYESPAATSDPRISELVERTAERLGLSHRHMPSGAGHDAQSFRDLAPLGMIFVPSRDGISHAPTEYTAPEQVTAGADVLLQTLLALDAALADD